MKLCCSTTQPHVEHHLLAFLKRPRRAFCPILDRLRQGWKHYHIDDGSAQHVSRRNGINWIFWVFRIHPQCCQMVVVSPSGVPPDCGSAPPPPILNSPEIGGLPIVSVPFASLQSNSKTGAHGAMGRKSLVARGSGFW